MHASLPVWARAAGTRVSCPHITELKNYCANSYYFFTLLLFLLLAATPVVSATTLAARLGIAVKNAIRLLDELVAADIAVEVTHRSRRRLFGLKGLAPLREGGSACRIVRNRGEGQGGRARWSTPKRPRRRCHSSRRWRAGPVWRFRPSWSQTRRRRPALPEGGAAQ